MCLVIKVKKMAQSKELLQNVSSLYQRIDEQLSKEEIKKTYLTELKTVQDVVRFTVSLFSNAQIYVGHGTDNY